MHLLRYGAVTALQHQGEAAINEVMIDKKTK